MVVVISNPQQAHTDAQTNLGTFLYKSIPFSQLPTDFWGLLVPAVEQTAIYFQNGSF
jgi:hypothetical protein